MNHINKIYAPIIIALTLLAGVFFVRPLYTEYNDAKIYRSGLEKTQQGSQKNLDALAALQSSFANTGSTNLTERVKKLDKKWNEAQIMAAVMLTDFTKGALYDPARVTISSINLDKGKKLPSGLSLGTVRLTITAKSITDLVNFLTYLTQSSSYVFTLDNITLPLSVPTQKDISDISLPVSLGVYYFE